MDDIVILLTKYRFMIAYENVKEQLNHSLIYFLYFIFFLCSNFFFVQTVIFINLNS